MRRSWIFSLSIAVVAFSGQWAYAQRTAYPTQDQPAYYSQTPPRSAGQNMDRYQDQRLVPPNQRFRPQDSRYMESRRQDRDRFQQEVDSSRRYRPANYQNRPENYQSIERVDDRYASRYDQRYRDERYRDQLYRDQRQRYAPVGYRQDQRGVDPLIGPGPTRPGNQAAGQNQGRLNPPPTGGEQLPRLQDRPRLNPPVGNNRPSPTMRPHPGRNQDIAPGTDEQLQLNPPNTDVPRMRPATPHPAPAGHPPGCGCSSCGGGYSQGGSYDSYGGCDTGCDTGYDDRRYSRYFQDGYDRMSMNRGCRKGLCGGCSSCLGGRRGGRRRGGCSGGCGLRGGCGGGCGSGYSGNAISDYEYKFYGPRPGGRYFDDCGQGGCNSGGCSTGGCGVGGGCGTGDCYDDGCGPLDSRLGRQDNVYRIVGASWLLLERDGADFYPLSYENAMPTNRLLLDSADQSAQNGVEVFYARQNDCGSGWELRYWGIYENQSDAFLGNMPQTEIGGFAYLNYPTGTDVQSHYNSADFHGVVRDSQLHNIEMNIFRIASGCGPRNKFILRGLGGFRVINFQDEFNYYAFDSASWGTGFNRIDYQIDTNNTILATQLGATGEYCISPRVRLSLGAKAGIGANLISARQQVINSAGTYARDIYNNDFCYHNDQTEVSAFGELNTSVLYHVSDCFRLRFGYRVVGFTGIALAYEQIPYDFRDVQELNNIKSDGSLFYHGLQLGGEYCY